MTWRLPIFSLFLAAFLSSCMEKEFGFKNNPAAVLFQAHKAIQQNNVNRFYDLLGREALCLYGHEEGVQSLRNQVLPQIKQYELEVHLEEKQHLLNTRYIGNKTSGYWSYYTENYRINILHKKSRQLVAETFFNCDFGVDGTQNKKFLYLPPKDYPVKNCRLIKIIGHELETKKMTPECKRFAVER